jgi:hypothetical protein
MSGATICHGCGQRLEVPADYTRARMRCPECGVMCDVPPPEAQKSSPKRPAQRQAPPKSEIRNPKSEIQAEKPKPSVAEQDLPIPLAPEPPPAPPLPPLEEDIGTDEDDGKPYRVAGPKGRKCPDCSAFMRPEERQCPRCGFDLATGKKPAKSFTPVERVWEAGWSLRKRRNFFVLGLLLVTPIGFVIAYETEAWSGYIGSLVFFAGMTAFLLGTYARIDLARNKRGKITMTKTWRILFVQRPPIEFDVREFEGVRTGLARDVHMLDWLIAGMLLPAGLFPGILWWYFFIQVDSHYVALLKEHGYPSDVLYQGISETVAKDMATTLRDVAGLPYEQA